MTLFGYSFASGIALIILVAVYMLLMRNTTNFTLNRACLLGIMIVSLVVPFVTLPSLTVANPSTIEFGDLDFSATADVTYTPVSSAINFLRIVGIIYIIGVALMVARTAANFLFIFYLLLTSRKTHIGLHSVRVHNHSKIPPMSWGGQIFIADSLLDGDPVELDMILSHEDAHRRRCHWLDLLLSNAVLAINWYNPAAWILQHEIIAVHEYEADRIASGQSGDKMKYQLLLIKKTAGVRFHAFADSLNHSSLNKRITMMMKNQSKSSALLRPLALLPAVAVALLVSNSACVKAAQSEVSEAESVGTVGTVETADNNTLKIDEIVVVAYSNKNSVEEEKVYDIATPPKYVGGEEGLYKKLAEVINFVGDVNETGRIVVGFTIDADGKMVNPYIVKGLSEVKNNEALRAVKELTDWTPALTKDGKKVPCNYTLPILFKNDKDNVSEVQSEETMSAIKYPTSDGGTKLCVPTTDNDKTPVNPLIIIDGTEADLDAWQALKTSEIESVAVLNEKEVAKYGEKGANGVVVVVTKAAKN